MKEVMQVDCTQAVIAQLHNYLATQGTKIQNM